MEQATSRDDVELIDALGNVDEPLSNEPDILNSLDLNSEDNQELAQCGPVLNRGSKRRSSILKLAEAAEVRKSRRVSWAKTFECRKLLSDGTTTEVINQQLNKYGPDLLLPLKRDAENQPPEGDEKMKRRRSSEHFIKIFSKYYNLEGNSKDIETIRNTASNLYGLQPEEMEKLWNVFTSNNPEKYFGDFLKTLHQVPVMTTPKDPFLSEVKPSSQEVDENKNPNFTLIADLTMDPSAFQNICNSTNVFQSDQSVHQFWPKNPNDDISSIEDEKTLHETTFMKISDEEDNVKKTQEQPCEATKELTLMLDDDSNDKPKLAASGFLANMQAAENIEPDLSINLSDDDKLKSDDKGSEKQSPLVENTCELMSLSDTKLISAPVPVAQSNNFLARLQLQQPMGETKSLDLESKSTIYPADTKSNMTLDKTEPVKTEPIEKAAKILSEVSLGFESRDPEKTLVREMREGMQIQALYADSLSIDKSNASKSIVKPNQANSFSIFVDPTHNSQNPVASFSIFVDSSQHDSKPHALPREEKSVSESQKENLVLEPSEPKDDGEPSELQNQNKTHKSLDSFSLGVDACQEVEKVKANLFQFESQNEDSEMSLDLSMDQTLTKELSFRNELKESTRNLSLDLTVTQKHTTRLDSPMVTLNCTSLTQASNKNSTDRFHVKLSEHPTIREDPPTADSIDLELGDKLQKTLEQLQNLTENLEFSMAQMDDSTTADIKVDVIEITNNRIDTCSQEEYVATKPFLGKSASAILEEEDIMETEDIPESSPNVSSVKEQSVDQPKIQPEKLFDQPVESNIPQDGSEEPSTQQEAMLENEAFVESTLPRSQDRFQPNLSVLVEEIEPSFYTSKRTSLFTGLVDRTRKDTISVATLNSELNTIGQRLNVMSGNTFSFNRLSQIGSFSSASKTTRLGPRAAATKLPAPPPPPAPKQIELDFNTSNGDQSMPEIESGGQIEQSKPNQFIRKSLGLDLREKLIQRQQELQKTPPSSMKAVDLEIQKHQETKDKIRELEVELERDCIQAFDRTEPRISMATFNKSNTMNISNKINDLYNLSILNTSKNESKVAKTTHLDIDLSQTTNHNKLDGYKSEFSRLDFEFSVTSEKFERSSPELSQGIMSLKSFTTKEDDLEFSKAQSSRFEFSQTIPDIEISKKTNYDSFNIRTDTGLIKSVTKASPEKMQTLESMKTLGHETMQLSSLSQINNSDSSKTTVKQPIDNFSISLDQRSKAHLSRFEVSKPDLSELNLSDALSKRSVSVMQSMIEESNIDSSKRVENNETLPSKKLKTSIVEASVSKNNEISINPTLGLSLSELKELPAEVSTASSSLHSFEHSALERSALRLLALNETQADSSKDDSLESTFVAESVLSPIKSENDDTINVTDINIDYDLFEHDLERTIYKPKANMSICDFEQTLAELTIPHYFDTHGTIDLSKLISQIFEKKNLKLRIQALDDNAIYIRFLFSTLELRVHFGARLNRPSSVDKEDQVHREIVALDLVNLLQSDSMEAQFPRMSGREEKPIYDDDWMRLRFKDEHRSYLHLAHDIVHNNFSEKRLKEKFRDTSKLFELIQEFYLEVVSPARKMANELRWLHSWHPLKIIDRDSEGRFRIMVDILGLRNTISVIIAFDHLTYPDEVIHPQVIVSDEDKHIYPYGSLDQFSNAFLKIKPHKFKYISRLLRGGRLYIAAIRKVMCQEKRQQQQAQAIRDAKFVPTPPQS